jgi:hypothetical protein
MRNALCFALLSATCLVALQSRIAFAASAAPTSQPADTPEERAKWMGRIQFWGNETTGEWSLRIKDADVDKQRLFRLRQLWMYDRQAKRWVRLGTTMLASWMLPANKKKRDPDNPDTDGAQTLAVLPIDKDQVGIYYAKWTVDGVHGTTFCRIGPGLKNKADYLHKEPPEGHIWVALPLDRDHAEPAVIPDPEVACK